MAYFTEDGRLQIGRRLFACRACGFLSTRGPEFTTRNGVILDRDCAEAADMGLEPIAGWVAEAIAAEERRSKAVPPPMSIAHDILCQHNRPCPYCGTRMRVPESNTQRRKAASGRCLLPDLPTRDHAIPKSRMPAMGVLYACRRCNQDKADRTVIEWHALLASRGDPRAAIVAAWIKANASTQLRSYDGLKARPRPDPIPTPSEMTP